MPRRQSRARRALSLIEPRYFALSSGPGSYQGESFTEKEVERLWKDYRETFDDPQALGALWRFEHGLAWDLASAAAHQHVIASRRGVKLDDPEVLARAKEEVADDPRL